MKKHENWLGYHRHTTAQPFNKLSSITYASEYYNQFLYSFINIVIDIIRSILKE